MNPLGTASRSVCPVSKALDVDGSGDRTNRLSRFSLRESWFHYLIAHRDLRPELFSPLQRGAQGVGDDAGKAPDDTFRTLRRPEENMFSDVLKPVPSRLS